MPEHALPNNDRHDVYAALTRLNSRLLAMQRELEGKNLELKRLAYYDALTDLLNRHAIMDKLDEWLVHVRRYRTRLSIAMLDIDHFKQVNDTRGHCVGDRVLSDVAGVLRRSIRQTDFVGRYGGEEFLVILPGTDAAGAAIMGERIRAALAGTPMVDPTDGTFPLTVSMGIAEHYESDDEDLLISRADTALYRAKEMGRNRVEVAPFPLSSQA